jgi:two-component system nitrogen regulation sensor histidine kinase NtrY
MSELHDTGEETQADGARPRRRRSATWLFGGLVLLLLSVLVVLQVFGLWEIFTPDTPSDTLLIYALSSLNFVAFFVFAFVFIRSLVKLRRERRERRLGSKIKTRLVVYFIAVSLLPITAMAVFSFLFLNRSLEKWFGRIPEDVVNDARRARDEDVERRSRELLDAARIAALHVESAAARGEEIDAGVLLRAGGFAAVSHDPAGGDQRTRFAEGVDFIGTKDLDAAIDVARERRAGGRLGEPSVVVAHGVHVAAVPLADGGTFYAARPGRMDASLDRIVSGAETFEQLRRQQRKVRMLGLSTIGLMTLLLLFAATWSAIHLARGIGTPILALAEAAKRVAEGDLTHRVTAVADDELALLAAAFNDMTAQLASNRAQLEQSASELGATNTALEERRGYIETVLESLSTGVVSLDGLDRVTTINAAALQMLRLERQSVAGAALGELVGVDDYAVLSRLLWRARLRGRASEQAELAPEGEDGSASIPVALTATALAPREGEKRRAVVLVMEDLTELLAAQRAAAWSEVARRMAHEIKNPLTPIQLSAERIARNFQRYALDGAADGNGASEHRPQTNAPNGGGESERERVRAVVEECTATISREVASLKAMVDEFARFARLPHARLEAGDLNEVVRQAVALYEDRLDGARLDVLLAPRLPGALLDSEQMRRVFVNLFENSLEALGDVEGDRRITVATAHDPARGLLLAEIADTGHGIPRENFQHLFQPYFSTRRRGTGLGLAIVQRVLSEHGGRIRAESNRPRGARMIVELPVADEAAPKA